MNRPVLTAIASVALLLSAGAIAESRHHTLVAHHPLQDVGLLAPEDVGPATSPVSPLRPDWSHTFVIPGGHKLRCAPRWLNYELTRIFVGAATGPAVSLTVADMVASRCPFAPIFHASKSESFGLTA